ncbi:MAG: hypothetical protein NUV63_12115 [Gallionella sp.]|nr:hypothetical protein [Gallionella sp.]
MMPFADKNAFADWLDSQDFYELCQSYRHAQDVTPKAKGLPTAAGAFETLKDAIYTKATK